MCFQTTLKYCIPSSITLLRVIAAPLFYYCFLSPFCTASFAIFIFAALTDMIDGISARYLSAASRFGAYADAVSDFVFIIAAFTGFIKIGWYSPWILIPIVVSFSTFIFTAHNKTLIYDPLGKYMGTITMGVIGCSLVFPFQELRMIFSYSLLTIVIVTIFFRVRYMKTY